MRPRLSRWCTCAVVRFALVILASWSFAPPPALPSPSATSPGEPDHPRRLCDEGAPLCPDPVDPLSYEGRYIGHDEPSLVFYSTVPGSGNSVQYTLRLPTEPSIRPRQDGTGGTFNFQVYPAFWLGMALCDPQSAPEFTHADCVPNSDTNIFENADPSATDYIGKHPGTAFLELQFYPPGWVPWPASTSCDATQWCAALNIFSFNFDQNAGVANNQDCQNKVGLEPDNFAFLTKSGVPHGPRVRWGRRSGA